MKNNKKGIDTYFIPHINHLGLSLKGKRLFALAHFVLQKNKKYIDFFKNNNDMFITLDSGVAEGSRVPVNEFMQCAKDIKATEIICPDELYDCNETIKLTHEFIDGLSIKDKKKYKFMMVPQGNNIENFVKCLKALQKMPECSCIGISKFDAPKIMGKTKDIHKVCESRQRLIDYLVSRNLLTKPVHCLGYDNPKEFSYYIMRGYKFIRSCDSASAILCGMKNIKFAKNGLEVVKPAGGDIYHVTTMSDKQVDLSLYNINITKKLCGNA